VTEEQTPLNLRTATLVAIASGAIVLLGSVAHAQAPPPGLVCPSSSVSPGASFNVTVNGGSSARDWVALYGSGAGDMPVPQNWKYAPLPRPSTLTFKASTTIGNYEARLFANDGYTRIAVCAYQVAVGPSLSISDATVTEGSGGPATATFTVSLAPTSTSAVTVNYATADGTATAGSDYVASSGTVSFAPGETTKTIAVAILGDSVPEPDETFFVNLSSPAGATVLDGQGVGTIVNDDGAPVLLTCPAVVYPGTAFNATAIGGSSARDWIASYKQGAPDSPVPPYQYVTLPRPRTLNFVGPATLGSYELRLFANDGYTRIAVCPYTVSVGPSVSIDDVTVTEGNSGSKVATFTVTMSPPSTDFVEVDFRSADGTATVGSDYGGASGTRLFSPGQATATIDVLIRGDSTAEPDETFFVDLTSAPGASIRKGRGVGTILNDDAPPPPLTCPLALRPGDTFFPTAVGGTSAKDWMASYPVGAPDRPVPANWMYVPLPRPASKEFTASSIDGNYEIRLFANDGYTRIGTCPYEVSAGPALGVNDATAREGGIGFEGIATFTVSLTPSTHVVAVDYATADITATGGLDYVPTSGTLTFAPGEVAKTVSVPIIDDAVGEPLETFSLNLSSAVGATIFGAKGTGSIFDNDVGYVAPLSCPTTPITVGTKFTVYVYGGQSSLDWLGTYDDLSAPDSPAPADVRYVPLPRPVPEDYTPTTPGFYSLRLFADYGWDRIDICNYRVVAPGTAPTP
jgi:Calx-beta domain